MDKIEFSEAEEIVRLSRLVDLLSQRWKQRRPRSGWYLGDHVALDSQGNAVLRGDFTLEDLKELAGKIPADEELRFMKATFWPWEWYKVRRVEKKKLIGLLRPEHRAKVVGLFPRATVVLVTKGRVRQKAHGMQAQVFREKWWETGDL